MQAAPDTMTGRMGERRSFKSPFSRFGDKVYCPHCGHAYPASELGIQGTAGEGLTAVVCAVCRAHGAFPSDALSERGSA